MNLIDLVSASEQEYGGRDFWLYQVCQFSRDIWHELTGSTQKRASFIYVDFSTETHVR